MSEKESPQENQAASPVGEISHGPSGFDAFLDANQKKLMIIGVLLVFGVVAYVIISGLRQTAREEASAEISAASDLVSLRTAYDKHKDTPSGAVALDKIAKIQWQDQRQDEAIKTLQSVVSEYPEHPLLGSVQMTLGDYQRQLGQLDKAKESYEAAVASDSAVSSPALLALGDLALRENNNEVAKSSFTKVDSDYGERHSSFKNIADAHKKLVGTMGPTEVAPASKEGETTPSATVPDLAPLPPLNPAPVPVAPVQQSVPTPAPIGE
ncbi:tetratricopeptide repeat protein [Akkermansiaceae bacterium]|nr:tetratricopeptide repeat protein [Akkermansiaceae bacterium]MDB4467239.1 tetratricopeptide repeat protein [Akkermansiaceae bacterium]MDB4569588.1 tetratricopeptide repeat protein [Akkermansiaceae bacterium]